MSLWGATKTFWIKYCGIADEYRMLRDRWLYLHERGSLPTLPYLKTSTFATLNGLVDSLGRKFRELGFDRTQMENFKKYGRLLQDIGDLNRCSKVYNEIQGMLFDLATYVGLLKMAFLQRTVSSEISHVASGVPHSPERTIGNEFLYLAADKIARSYNDCLNLRGLRWDGVITFAPPKEALTFYGAFFRPSSYLPLFHISMSEEQKYFLGTYLVLAHEFGHAAIYSNLRIFRLFLRIAFEYSVGSHLASITELREDLPLENLYYSAEKCEGCLFYPFPLTDEKSFEYQDLFDDFLADLIAVHIGGLNTAEVFLDEIFRYSVFLTEEENGWKIPFIFTERSVIRISGLLSYLNQIGLDNRSKKRLDFRFKKLIKLSKECFDVVRREEEETLDEKEAFTLSNVCIECLSKIGEQWGNQIGRLDQECRRRQGMSVFSYFIKENKFLSIDENIENEIIESLLAGIPITQQDPRYILHAYHEAHKQSEGKNRPNYATAVHSIACNRFI